MAEYIKREAAIDAVTEVYYDTPDVNISGEKFEDAINGIPASDVAPVVHGRWIEREDPMLDTYYTCSACNEDFYIEQTGNPVKDLFTYTYCPSCGAKMDEKEAVYD